MTLSLVWTSRRSPRYRLIVRCARKCRARDGGADTHLSVREDLREPLNRIPGVAIPPDAIRRRPSVPLEKLVPVDSRQLLMDAFGWVLQTIRNPLTEVPTDAAS